MSLKERCDQTLPDFFCFVGNLSGWISSFIWLIVLFPQVIKNWKNKSVEGVSLLWALLNFSASYVNIFFIYHNSLPLFSLLSRIYMPILEFFLLLQFYYYGKYTKREKRIALSLFLFSLIILTSINTIFSHLYINELEWIAIVLWSIETFPQIYLNFKLKSTRGLSSVSQVICFLGKTSDISQNYFLNIPIQYRYLAFFSSSSAYFNNLQVLIYDDAESSEKSEVKDQEFKQVKMELTTENYRFSLFKIILVIIVSTFLLASSIGFILRTENWIESIFIVFGFYSIIFIFYIIN